MYENFTRISPNEQQRILDACLDEFARHGYAGASTNAIVKQAGIPKGTLFYYFGSKKDLYLYLVDRAIAQYVQHSEQHPAELPGDLFERLLFLGRERMRFALREPRLYRLLFNAFVNLPAEIQPEMQARFGEYAATGMQQLTQGLDHSPFRPGVEVEQVVAMVTLLMEGIYNRSLPELARLSAEESLVYIDRLTGEVALYFDLIRRGVYKSP